LSVGVDKYLEKLIDNCYEKDVQDNVKTQLAILGEKKFSQQNQQDREKL